MTIHSEPTPAYWPSIWITLASYVLLLASFLLVVPTIFAVLTGIPVTPVPPMGLILPVLMGLMMGSEQLAPPTAGEGG